tara:strand:+ start:1260 stop:1703 length:444 start_codon:yes stop_codon:yes gene_type:complete
MTQTKYFEIEEAARAKVEQQDGKKYIYVGTPEADALHKSFEACGEWLKIGQLINVVFDRMPPLGNTGQRTRGTWQYSNYRGDFRGPPITIIPVCRLPQATEGYDPAPEPPLGEEWLCEVITYYAYQNKEFALVIPKIKKEKMYEWNK